MNITRSVLFLMHATELEPNVIYIIQLDRISFFAKIFVQLTNRFVLANLRIMLYRNII